MKRKYFVLTAVVLLMGALVYVSAFAEKEKCNGPELPETVKAAVAKVYPDTAIEEVEMKKEVLMLYEVEVEKEGIEYELTIAPDGTIVAEETEIDASELPQAVTAALTGAEIKEVSKEVKSWAISLKKLDAPVVSYEVETVKDGAEKELTFAADGTIIKPCCAKKMGCPMAGKKGCPMAAKAGCDKEKKEGCPKAAAEAGCAKAKKAGCPKTAAEKKECTKAEKAEAEDDED